MKRTTVVVPCFNEAGRIQLDVFREFVRSNPDVGFLMVNDGSTDDTLAELHSLAAADADGFEVLDLETNRGKAEAVRRGVLAAAAGGAEYIGYWDADLATPLGELPGFIEILDDRPDRQFLLGARVLLLGRAIDRHSIRHYAGRIVATAASFALRLPVYDTQCGAKLFRNTEVVRSAFEEPFIAGWTFDVEVLARVVGSLSSGGTWGCGEAIFEVPLFHWRDVPGSKVRKRDFFVALLDLLRIHRYYVRNRA